MLSCWFLVIGGGLASFSIDKVNVMSVPVVGANTIGWRIGAIGVGSQIESWLEYNKFGYKCPQNKRFHHRVGDFLRHHLYTLLCVSQFFP